MRQESMIAGVVIPNFIKYGWNVCRGILLLTFCHIQWVGYVSVVRDTPILTHLQVVVVENEMQIVFVASVASKQSTIEQGGRLVVVHTSSVNIIDVKPES